MRLMMNKLLLALVTICTSSWVQSQNIKLDHPIKCGKLQCYPSAENSNEYYYLPANPHVALNDKNRPEFSFTRYVSETGEKIQGMGDTLQAKGGGIVHFLVEYTASKKSLRKALESLKEDNEDAILRGPIIYESGTFALVSSFVKNENTSELSKQIIGVGKAPLLEGLKAAVSIHLTDKGAKILWQSFQMSTPDISLVFEMSYSGLSDPAEASIIANWDKLQQQADKKLGVKASYMGIGAGFDYSSFWNKARNSGAIKIEYKGDPNKLQNIIDRTYLKLHEMMFEPLPVEKKVVEENDNVSDLIAAASDLLIKPKIKITYPWEVNISSGYKRRKLQQSGSYRFDFKQSSKSTITTAMAGNIGGLYKKYGNDQTMFKTVSLSAKEFQIRQLTVALDAYDESNFSKYVNNVTLTMKKNHGSGQITQRQLSFNRSNYKQGQLQNLYYNWDGEGNENEWLNYQYKTDWSFVGGSRHAGEWQKSSDSHVSLIPPFRYQEVEFLTSEENLTAANVRLVTIKVKHKFFGREVKETINLIPGRKRFSVKRNFAMPFDHNFLEYEVTWTLNDHSKIKSGILTSEGGVIFCDELPPQT